jgi:DNA-binding CsgD family transcriptional regulator
VRLDRPSAIAELLTPLRELLGSQAICAYGLCQNVGDRYDVEYRHSEFLDETSMSTLFPAYVAGEEVRWGGYNPGRPEPKQRNRVMAFDPAAVRAHPLARDLYVQIGIGGLDQLRVLVCEGPSLLGWVGAWQSGRYEPWQATVLAALVPDLRRRLSLDRQLGQRATSAMLEAALDAIGRVAFIVAENGRILEANAAARALLEKDSTTTREQILAAVTARGDHPRWLVTRARADGQRDEVLVLERSRTGDERTSTRVAEAATRWSLTRRQQDILAKVAEGNANQSIAAMLGLSERTVEVHVTALLDKAQVECRSELVAKVYGAP